MNAQVGEPVAVNFDRYAGDYEAALAQGLAVSGENKDFFAERRIAWLARCLDALGEPRPGSVLDFGCGVGSATPFLLDRLGAGRVLGVDPSVASVTEARRQHPSDRAAFSSLADYRPDATFDLAFCNGVFHHIPPAERAEAIEFVSAALRPGGLFAFWENNPWNPGTRYVMSRIPFDRDACPLSAPASSELLRASGFEILRVDFLFIFPRFLSGLRILEPALTRLPLGAQYQVLCRKSQ